MRLKSCLSALAHDVLNIDAARRQRVRQEHAMALPPDGFSTHERDSAMRSELEKLVNGSRKFGRHHVVGVAAESIVSPRAVRRVGSRFPETT